MLPSSDLTLSQQPVLIVDDNPTNLSLLSKVLNQAGLEIAIANNGESALSVAANELPALILLDVMMPGIDGFETCRRFKANPATAAVPIIFMTALNEMINKVKGFNLGAVDYITKPFEEEEVIARVKLHLQLYNYGALLAKQNHELTEAIAQLQTAQKQIIAQEKLASLGTLTAGVAHELRNPLNFVNNFALGSSELTQELQLELQKFSHLIPADSQTYIIELLKDLKENAQSIWEHGNRAENIINSMMEHARADSGKHQPVDLNSLLEQSVYLAYQSKRNRDMQFHVTLEKSYDPDVSMIEAVSGDLTRAFINLADNACYALYVKYKEYKQENLAYNPTLAVKTEHLGDRVRVSLRDNGIGIPPAIVEKVFNPFFTTKPTGEGTGLGLSLTYDIIVAQHRGSLELDTQLGEYTEFVITLPYLFFVQEAEPA
ncbi:MAG: hybrid sensor histidine kinase/response regulator [Pseudanabaenaceae cyanobacterium bins.68]|nr:hybrid sensor histidine kinase/response regulator [Pseudanabaenaceae cyanobacterium bins.68]